MKLQAGDTVRVNDWNDVVGFPGRRYVIGREFILNDRDIGDDYIFPDGNEWQVNVPISAVTLIKKGNAMKFKVGDKVKVVNKIERYNGKSYEWNKAGKMDRLIGLVLTVKKITDGIILTEQHPDLKQNTVWYWLPECFELVSSKSSDLKDRINALQNIGQEAFEIMAEIGGKYDIVIPTIPSSNSFLTVLKDAQYNGINQHGKVLADFECANPCQVGEAYKKALLFIAEREGKLGHQVGDNVTTEIDGKKYQVKILQEA